MAINIVRIFILDGESGRLDSSFFTSTKTKKDAIRIAENCGKVVSFIPLANINGSHELLPKIAMADLKKTNLMALARDVEADLANYDRIITNSFRG